MKPFLDELRASNPTADLIYVPGEVSLLAEVKRISLDIKSREPTIDLLFLSAGYAPLGGRIGMMTPACLSPLTRSHPPVPPVS